MSVNDDSQVIENFKTKKICYCAEQSVHTLLWKGSLEWFALGKKVRWKGSLERFALGKKVCWKGLLDLTDQAC